VRLPRRKHQFDRIAQGIDQGRILVSVAADRPIACSPFFFARRRYVMRAHDGGVVIMFRV